MSALTPHGLIPAGQPCPYLRRCAHRCERCPTTEAPKTVDYSCAAARAWAAIEREERTMADLISYNDEPDVWDWHNIDDVGTDASVEGTSEEMRAIAAAIENSTNVRFKRCAVDATKGRVELWSPRNSTRRGIISREEGLRIAALIRERCGHG